MADLDIMIGESIALPEGESLFEQPEMVRWEDATDCIARVARAQAWALISDARAAGLTPDQVTFRVGVEVLTADGESIDLRDTGAEA